MCPKLYIKKQTISAVRQGIFTVGKVTFIFQVLISCTVSLTTHDRVLYVSCVTFVNWNYNLTIYLLAGIAEQFQKANGQTMSWKYDHCQEHIPQRDSFIRMQIPGPGHLVHAHRCTWTKQICGDHTLPQTPCSDHLSRRQDCIHNKHTLLIGFEELDLIDDPSRLFRKDYYFRYLRDDQDFADACLLHVDTEMELVVKDASMKHDPTLTPSLQSSPQLLQYFNPTTRNAVKWAFQIWNSVPGTRSTFYLVPVTEELSKAVITGHYPGTPSSRPRRS
jgi:hypothetical protein